MTDPAERAALDAEIRRLLEPNTPEVVAIALAAVATLRTAMPEGSYEAVDHGSRLVAFGRTPRMRDLLFAVAPHGSHVNLQLADGAALPDPTGIVEGTGKRIRHVKLRSPEDAGRADVRALIAAELAVSG